MTGNRAIIFYRRKADAGAGLVLCLMLLFVVGVPLTVVGIYGGRNGSQTGVWLFVGVVAVLVSIVGMVASIAFLADNKPKLMIDEEGVTDYRGWLEPRLIRWQHIRSMETDIARARVCLYVKREGRSTEAVFIRIGELDDPPTAVARTMKQAWIDFTG